MNQLIKKYIDLFQKNLDPMVNDALAMFASKEEANELYKKMIIEDFSKRVSKECDQLLKNAPKLTITIG